MYGTYVRTTLWVYDTHPPVTDSSVVFCPYGHLVSREAGHSKIPKRALFTPFSEAEAKLVKDAQYSF